jgi:hypothetical protein
MGWPSASLRRGPDGFEFWLQGTMLKVAPVSTKYLSLVNSSVKKIKPAFAGKCIAVAVACVGKAADYDCDCDVLFVIMQKICNPRKLSL